MARPTARAPDAGDSALMADAERLIGSGDAAAAERLLVPLKPYGHEWPRLRKLLAVCALQANRTSEALGHARAAVALAPEDAHGQMTLGRVHKAAGELEAAVAAYRRAIELKPDFAAAHVSLGIALRACGDLAGAVDCYRQAIAIDPGFAVAHANLGNALAQLAEEQAWARANTESVAAHRRALALAPGRSEARRNLGVTLMHAGRWHEAAECFNEVLTRDVGDARSCLLLGHCLHQLGGADLAIEAYEKWLGLNPPDAAVMRALAAVQTESGHVGAALGWAEKALALEPGAHGLQAMAMTLAQARQVERSLDFHRRAIALAPGDPSLQSSFLMTLNYTEEDPDALIAAHRRFGTLMPPPRPLRLAPHQAGRPLRVGYLSGDFRRHSVSFFVSPLLEHHDRRRFEVFCYYNHHVQDPVTVRLQALGHPWRACSELTDGELLQQIEADRIDLLVDLSGHTQASRLSVMARRAAPVQLTYLGYPTLTGVPAIDFRISDRVIDPDDGARDGPEAVLHCAASMFCFRPEAAPEVRPVSPLEAGGVTFGSFNNAAKLSDRTLALWSAVLRAVPRSRLMLKSVSLGDTVNQHDIRAFMHARGIAPERLVFDPWRGGLTEHLSCYGDVDIALDTYPYNGATTSCEALWMGVPLVSRRGKTHASRMGASLLHAVGRGDWVADDDAGFVAIAAALAADAGGRSAWRRGARETLRRSPLMDHAGFTRGFESLLDAAWRRRTVAQAA